MEEGEAAERGAVPESALPQAPQRRFPAGLAAPHAGHVKGSGLPHCPQNRLLRRFWCPQLGQKIIPGFPVPCCIEPSMGLLH